MKTVTFNIRHRALADNDSRSERLALLKAYSEAFAIDGDKLWKHAEADRYGTSRVLADAGDFARFLILRSQYGAKNWFADLDAKEPVPGKPQPIDIDLTNPNNKLARSIKLHDYQKQAFESILSDTPRQIILGCDFGSYRFGKTVKMMAAVKEMLDNGEKVLVLTAKPPQNDDPELLKEFSRIFGMDPLYKIHDEVAFETQWTPGGDFQSIGRMDRSKGPADLEADAVARLKRIGANEALEAVAQDFERRASACIEKSREHLRKGNTNTWAFKTEQCTAKRYRFFADVILGRVVDVETGERKRPERKVTIKFYQPTGVDIADQLRRKHEVHKQMVKDMESTREKADAENKAAELDKEAADLELKVRAKRTEADLLEPFGFPVRYAVKKLRGKAADMESKAKEKREAAAVIRSTL